MKIGVLVILALAMVAVYVLVQQNRDSPEVLNAAVPLAVGAVSALWLVFAFSQPKPVSKAFFTTLLLKRAGRLPLAIPDRPYPKSVGTIAAKEEKQRKAPPASPPQEELSSISDHELIQAALVDFIAERYHAAWRVEVIRSESGAGSRIQWVPAPDADSHGSTRLDRQALERELAGNRFAPFLLGFGTLTLPPNTRMRVVVPIQGKPGEIAFSNRYCHVSITTSTSMAIIGLGAYAALSGISLDQAQSDYLSAAFIVRVQATFTGWLFGHPEMEPHREWATAIADGLADAFDDDLIWRRTRDNFTLRQEMAQAARLPRPNVDPVRLADPPGAKPTPPPDPKKPSPAVPTVPTGS